MKKIISILLCIALIATSFGAGASVSAAKKKKKAKAGTESMDLYYSKYASPKKLKDGHKLVKDFVINAKKKGKYTAKIKNKKIAKIAKDSKKRQYIYAKKAGKTKAKIYEKLKNHKKRYIGKITIKVKKEDMGDCAGQMLSDDDYKAFNNVFIKKHLGTNTANIDIKNIHATVDFEEKSFAFHNRLTAHSANVAKT